MPESESIVQDDPGRVDEYFARAIIIAPWAIAVVALLALNTAMAMSMLTFNITITGQASATYVINTIVKPLAFGFGALIGLAYLLAITKEWGLKPIKTLLNMAENYNP